MPISEHKIDVANLGQYDVASLQDRPSAAGMDAVTLKARFDALVKQVVAAKLNALIDAL